MRIVSAIMTVVITVLFFAMIFSLNLEKTLKIPEPYVPPPVLREQPPDGWAGMIYSPHLISYEDLCEMIEKAPHYSQTRPIVPHPERRMTEAERKVWISNYYLLGGINSQELELYKIVNKIRMDYDLPPFILCPELSMASRLFSYLQVKYHTAGHIDPYYESLSERINFFGVSASIYMENANSEKWYDMPDGSKKYIYLTPQELVDGWMTSDLHREHILTRETTHVGFGIDSGNNRVVPTMKSVLPK